MHINQCYMIFINAGQHPILDCPDQHNEELARAVIHCFGLDTYRTLDQYELEPGQYPEPELMAIGCYGQTIVLFSEPLARRCLDSSVPPFMKDIWAFWPPAKMLAVVIGDPAVDEDLQPFLRNGYAYLQDHRIEAQAADVEIDQLCTATEPFFRTIVGGTLSTFDPTPLEMHHYRCAEAELSRVEKWNSVMLSVGCGGAVLAFIALVVFVIIGVVRFLQTTP